MMMEEEEAAPWCLTSVSRAQELVEARRVVRHQPDRQQNQRRVQERRHGGRRAAAGRHERPGRGAGEFPPASPGLPAG